MNVSQKGPCSKSDRASKIIPSIVAHSSPPVSLCARQCPKPQWDHAHRIYMTTIYTKVSQKRLFHSSTVCGSFPLIAGYVTGIFNTLSCIEGFKQKGNSCIPFIRIHHLKTNIKNTHNCWCPSRHPRIICRFFVYTPLPLCMQELVCLPDPGSSCQTEWSS